MSDPTDVATADGPEAPATAAQAFDVAAEDARGAGAPAEGAPAEGAPAAGAPAEGAPAEGAPAEGAPAEEAPAEEAPAAEAGESRPAAQRAAERSPGRPLQLADRWRHSWGRGFDPDRLAILELRMWKAYYHRQPIRLFALLVRALREQANASLPRAALAAIFLTKAAAGFARATGEYERFAPDIARGYRLLGLPPEVDVNEVARHELAWWVVRREMGLAAGDAAGESITRLYAALYGVPEAAVADAGRLRGLAAEVRDRGATVDPDGPAGEGAAYWPEVARLLRESYRSLGVAIENPPYRPDH